MNTYIVSSLNRNEMGTIRPLSPDLNYRELFSTAPPNMNFDVKFSEKGYAFIFSGERIPLKFSYIGEERLFDLNTVNILDPSKMEFMLSLVNGIGILGRGGPLKYISSEIALLIGSSLFASSTLFETKRFSDREMHWQVWKDRLLAITLELPDTGFISIEGRKTEETIKKMELFPNENNRIVKIRVYNEKFKRKITIERDGKIRISMWPGKVGIGEFNTKSFYTFTEKMTEFYTYVGGALREDYE